MPPRVLGSSVGPILGLDTSGSSASVALLLADARGEMQSICVQDFSRQGHSQSLLGMIDEVLSQAGVAVSGLAALAVVNGPGAFTGLRVAVGVAQGLSIASKVPSFAVDSLSARAMAFALEVNKSCRCLVANDARLSEVYCGVFDVDTTGRVEALAPPRLQAPIDCCELFKQSITGDLVEPLALLGTGFKEVPLLTEWATTLDSAHLNERREPNIALGAAYCTRASLSAGNKGLAPAQLQPFYLRDKVAMTTAEQEAARQAR